MTTDPRINRIRARLLWLMAKSALSEDGATAIIAVKSCYAALEIGSEAELCEVTRCLPSGISVESEACNLLVRFALDRDDVTDVAIYWRVKTGRDKRTHFTVKRLSLIRARLRDGWTVQDCKKAVDACCCSDFHNGKNDNGVRYNDIAHIFSPERFERWVSAKKPLSVTDTTDVTEQTIRRRSQERNGR